LNKRTQHIVKFENIIIRNIKEELYYKNPLVYIFKIELPEFRGFSVWADELTARDVEYLGYAKKLKFYPEDKTWKQLIKENAKIINK
jgi:hypothetical protein